MAEQFMRINLQLTRCLLPIIVFIGTVGNAINIVVLTRPTLRSYACSHYFLALAVNNLFYSCFIIIYRLLADGYQYDLAGSSSVLCRMVTYILNICSALSPYFIVLASIDRYFVSSSKAERRKLSQVRVARWSIIVVIAFSALFYMSTPIVIDLRSTDQLGCRVRPDTVYNQAYVIIQVIVFAIITPCLMTLFGTVTIRNTQRMPVVPAIISQRRRTENQLVRMLLLQVGTHIVLVAPISVVSVLSILPALFKPTPIFFACIVLFRIPLHLSYTTTFFLYIFSAQHYRGELIRLLKKLRPIWDHARVHAADLPNR